MLKSLKLLACTSALGLMAVTANAASVIITPNPDPFDFGNVLIDTTATHTFQIDFSYDPEDLYLFDSWSLSPTDVFTPRGGNCGPSGCTIDITFSPRAVGPFSTTLTSTLFYSTEEGLVGDCAIGGNCFFPTFFTVQQVCEPGPTCLIGPILFQHLGTSTDITITGQGIAPVPLPAALPLLGGALATLGFFGWRRRRRTGSSIASFEGNPASAFKYKSLADTS